MLSALTLDKNCREEERGFLPFHKDNNQTQKGRAQRKDWLIYHENTGLLNPVSSWFGWKRHFRSRTEFLKRQQDKQTNLDRLGLWLNRRDFPDTWILFSVKMSIFDFRNSFADRFGKIVAAQNGTKLAILVSCWTGHPLLSRSSLTLQRTAGKVTWVSHLLCNLMQKWNSVYSKRCPSAQCPNKYPAAAPTGRGSLEWEGKIVALESAVKALPEKRGINRKQKLYEKWKSSRAANRWQQRQILPLARWINFESHSLSNTEKAATLLVHIQYIAEIHLSQG